MLKNVFKRSFALLFSFVLISLFVFTASSSFTENTYGAPPSSGDLSSNEIIRVKYAPINAVEYGADPTGNQDSTNELQTAIDDATSNMRMLFIPAGTYKISKPLKVTTFTHIMGEGARLTTIAKVTNDVDPNTQKDAIFIAEDTVRGTVYHMIIEGLHIRSEAPDKVDYGFYVPAATRLTIKDCVVYRLENGFYTNNTWLGVLESIMVQEAITGFNFEPTVDIPEALSGTSITATRLWAVNCEIGYNISHLQYSTFNSCACDISQEIAYRFKHSRGITMNSCGAEDNYGETIKTLGETSLTVNSMSALKHYGREEEGRGVLVFDDYSKVTINASQFARFYPGSGDITEPKNSYNLILGPDADITVIDTYMPLNGNPYINFTENNSIKYIDGKGVRTESGKGVERGSTTLRTDRIDANAPIDSYPYEQLSFMKYTDANADFPGGDGVVETYYMTTDEGYGYNRQVAYVANSLDVYERRSLTGSKPEWEAHKAYSVGDIIMPSNTVNGHYYECIQAGTTENTEPAFPLISGGEISDGTVIWKETGTFWSAWVLK